MAALLTTKLTKVYCRVWEWSFFNQWIFGSYKQERGCLTHFARLASTLLKDEESARNNHVHACKLPNIYNSNKPFLIWLLTSPPHLQYVATLPCNLSLTACFAEINFSHGSVATYTRCGGIYNIHRTANLPTETFKNWLRSDRNMAMSLWSHFFDPLCSHSNRLQTYSDIYF